MGDDFRIYFVKPERNGENNRTLVEAFEALNKTDYNFKPEWITSQECLQADGKGKQTYIFDPFEGEAFDHIRKCGYRIYGPRCILTNLLHGMDLPKFKKQPIYNLAMKDVKICCTSLDVKLRDEITNKVHLMAGKVERNLTGDVTHLIAGEVGSNKYLVAVENGKSVMVKDWVFKVWELSQDRHIMATDEVFQKYTCPPFLGITLVVSGFRTRERNQLRNFVIRGGGKYTGELRMNECTHLIVKEPQGAKYEAAKNWHIKIVQDRWLFDCMDKGRYLDPKPYQFAVNSHPQTVQTSTPERKSVVGPSISDISAITNTGLHPSPQQVDETTDMTSSRFSEQFSTSGRRCTVAETKIGNTFIEADLTISSADVFLDGCQIYLSGIKPAIQEKLRKIITAGCGLRSMEINDSITHVVIGEVVASDILVLNGLAECPHVVTVDWLMECFHQRSHVSEEKYLRSDLGLKIPVEYRNNKKILENSKLATRKSVEAGKEKNQGSQAFQMDAPSDMEMAELLSQYMDPQDEPKTNLMAASEDQTKVKEGCNDGQDVTIRAHEDVDEDELTQDPNSIHEENEADTGIFYKKKFIILGFDEEETEQLTMLIETKGGCIIPVGKTRQVADIAIVPLMGFPVNVTVVEILTNAWLQMCVEEDELLPYDDWLSRPIELPEMEPLTGCCLCVSGYVGVERECIMHLAQVLGASCQDHFARKSRTNLQANTHLVVNCPSGSKYEAAKKWNIPAVGKEWISACIKAGERVPEDEYLIEVLEDKRLQSVSTNPTSHVSRYSSTSSLPTPPKPNKSGEPDCETGDVFHGKECANNVNDEQMIEVLKPTKVNTPDNVDKMHSKVKNVEMSTGNESRKECQDRVPTSSAESSDSISKNALDIPVPEIQHHLLTPSLSSRTRNSTRKSACRPNQSENITAGCLKTPVDIQRQKWGQLTHGESPATSTTPQGLTHGGGETPGTFMQPNFKPKFNLEGVFNTPDTAVDLNKSTPLGETFRRQISKAVQNVTTQSSTSAGFNDVEITASQSQLDHLAPLHGVVIAVAKKLGHNHEQYNSIVVELGGNYSWHNGPHVTHFVFQGRPNDTNKEFRKARDERKIIVSPYWLFACKEQNCRVDESLFPHNYNPNYNLSLTPGSKITPSRSSRTMLRSKGQIEPPTKSAVVSVGKTPSKKIPVLNLQKSAGKDIDDTALRKAIASDVNSPVSHNDARQRRSRTTTEVDMEIVDNVSVNVEAADSSDGNMSNEDMDNRSNNQEVKKALSKTLGNVLAEATRSLQSTKKKGKNKRFSGQLNASDGNTSEDNIQRTGASGRSSNEGPQKAALPEPSQSLQVTWEDPTEIMEKERLAHQLKQADGPSQNTDDLLVAIEIPGDKSNAVHKSNDCEFKSGTKDVISNKSPTPEPPPLAFPIAKPTSKILSPQPIELLSDESSDSRMDTNLKTLPAFLVSGLTNQERVDYSALVEQLGGKMIEKQHFDPACTHLVMNQPTRNEKYLSCIACGKWVLHQSYFEACRKEGKFIKEDPYEWGSSFTLPLMRKMPPQANKLAAAAYKWREKIAAMKKINTTCKGAYDGWKVLLCLDKTKEDNFQRLLEAGGAEVSKIRSPFPENMKGTHAFVDVNKVKIPQDDLEKLLEADIHCLKPEYIPAFLTEEPPPDPSEFYPPEFIALKASLSEPLPGKKRRRENDEYPSSNKRR